MMDNALEDSDRLEMRTIMMMMMLLLCFQVNDENCPGRLISLVVRTIMMMMLLWCLQVT